MIEYANTTVNAKSMLGLLSAASDSMKYQLTLVVDGEDEEAAVRAITGLVDSHFE
jgi:phosphotransferase system HPr-like phosphotransfer protein